MKKRKQITAVILSVIVAMTAFLPTQVFAAAKGIPGKVALTKISTKSYNQVTLNWKKEPKSTKYAIYYKEGGKKKWKKIATVSAQKTGYTHKSSKKNPIVVGKKYDYTVRGYNSKTKKYGSYDKKGLRVQTRPDTAKLKSVRINKNGSVTVQWKAAGGADKYMIYRKTSDSKWKKIGVTSGKNLRFTDRHPIAGKKNIYTVRSYNSKAKISGKYNSKGLTASKGTPGVSEEKPEPTPEEKPEPTPEVTPEPKPEPTPEPKPEPTPEEKPEPTPEEKPEPTPEEKPEPKPEVKPEPTPEEKPEPKPEPTPEVKPEPTPEPTPEVKPEPTPEPTPEVKPEPTPEPKPEPTPEVTPEPKPEPTPEVKPEKPHIPVEYVVLSFDGRYADMVVGDTLQVSATVMPPNASKPEVRWESLNPDILSIDKNGKITALKKGTGRIIAKTWDGKDGLSDFTVRNPGEPLPTKPEDEPGYIPVTKLEIIADKTNFDSFEQTAQYKAKIYPENATNKKINWYSTDGSVVMVDSNGQLTIRGEGTAYVGACVYDGKNEKVQVTVKLPVSHEPYVEAIGVRVKWNKHRYIRIGEKNLYKAQVVPSNATNQTIRWTSSDENVIKIDQNGMATAVGQGKAMVVAYAESGPGQGMELEVDLNYWPEETPEPTPEEKPEPTPEPTPEEKPEPTPEPKPEEKPEPTPEPTPEEKPEPTPEPTPEEKPEPTPEEKPEENVQAYLDKVLELTNQIRGQFSALRPYETTPELQRAASIRAKELAQKFSHERPDGRACGTVLRECGVNSFLWCGENIAYGYATPEDVVTGWRNSGGHYGNMIDSHFQKMGVGYYRAPDGRQYWVQLFIFQPEK